MTTSNLNNQENELFELYDQQADDDVYLNVMSLSAVREWLVDLWNENPDDEMTDEEHEEMIEEIKQSDEAELRGRLSGVGYYIEEFKSV